MKTFWRKIVTFISQFFNKCISRLETLWDKHAPAIDKASQQCEAKTKKSWGKLRAYHDKVFNRADHDLLSAKKPDDPQEINLDKERKEYDVPHSTHVFFILLVALFALFIAWSLVFKVDVASNSEGEVVPSSQVKKVQHLEGGIIDKILVQEGDRVKKGQILVVLSPTSSSADLDQLHLRITSAKVDIIRLETELAGGKTLNFPEDFMKKHPKIINESRKLFLINNEKYQHDYTIQYEKLQQKKREVKTDAIRFKHLKDELALLQQQVKISSDLLKENITSRYNHITLQREAKGLEGRVIMAQAELEQARSTLSEADNILKSFVASMKKEMVKRIEQTHRDLNEYLEQLEKYNDTYSRTLIKSPVDGVVRQMYIVTQGAVVPPGGTILDILPINDTLIIESKLPIADIGYIYIGQRTKIMLASADASRFEPLEGTVFYISADAIKDEDGNSFYKVKIKTNKTYFQKDEHRYQLYPGMKVSVAIITGRRSVMNYIFQPVLGTFSSSLHER